LNFKKIENKLFLIDSIINYSKSLDLKEINTFYSIKDFEYLKTFQQEEFLKLSNYYHCGFFSLFNLFLLLKNEKFDKFNLNKKIKKFKEIILYGFILRKKINLFDLLEDFFLKEKENLEEDIELANKRLENN